jgi:hypothetical protein
MYIKQNRVLYPHLVIALPMISQSIVGLCSTPAID